MTAPAKRPGRRPGSADTRGEILDAARAEFATRGYEKATVRGIARAAGVDSALVHHYFGSKDRVFLAALEFPVDPAMVLGLVAGDPAGIGERLARGVVGVWEEPQTRERLLAVVRTVASNEEMAALLRGFARPRLIAPLAAQIGGPDAEARVEMAMAQIVGLTMTRYVIAVEPIASLSPEKLVGLLAPALQRLLAG
ncbi:TetR family transcriptional regulator [Catenulispora sp. NF23]|uniref:TetR family transcriptional regulator n=1 Tax=Catenulispora pinistramenti TaxID=2705254 RepID=A0ABS5L512_9ACTN|nr:TetR family transcriptional regulator [Catenulispora pinistramenti]MBS2534858.1 TetR family transcriptional regulator [Catenulispora pinistramenti]MBS2553386.1 TetR family transcriptional regulator [Catenulispora pinistramenti]